MDAIRVSSFLSLLLISSFVSVVFDFNDSLDDAAPVSPTSLPVVVKKNEKNELLMDIICVVFCLHHSY